MTVICLNVGGVQFYTSSTTLSSSETFFSGLVHVQAQTSHHGAPTELFVDRDPTHFRFILNWLRGVRYLPSDDAMLGELLHEADFYSMHDMVQSIRVNKGTHPPVTRTLYEICRSMK